MKKNLFTAILLVSYILTSTLSIADAPPAANAPVKIYTFTLNKDIMPAAWRIVKKAVEEAEAMNADYIIMKLNTYGGMVDIADSIRTKLLKAKPVVIVLIDNNAASAGALISLACDSIYMVPGANIGAATVVNQTGEQMPDKYQSYMRSTMRSTAETQGRDPKIAEAMVDDRVSIPGVIDSGYTLTFTTKEAIKNNYCEGEASSVEDVIKNKLKLTHYELTTFQESSLEKVIAFLLHPVVSSLLILLIIGGLYFELQTPGVGFPLIAAIIGAALYFAPLYLEGLAENWEILIFVAGLALLILEIFVIPGFGIAGISGIALIVAGLTLALIRNVAFDFSLTGMDEIAAAFFRVVVTILAALLALLLFGRNIYSLRVFQKMILQDAQNRHEGYTVQDIRHEALIGKEGITITDLRPAGTVEIDEERYDVISDAEHVARGTKVKVVKTRGNYLVVQKI